jgi:hypothetical protein
LSIKTVSRELRLLGGLVLCAALLAAATPPAPARAAEIAPTRYLPFLTNGPAYAYTLYTNRSLWEAALGAVPLTEDFERDEADYGELPMPFLTGNGLTLSGQSSAQILADGTLLPSGTLLHFRDWASGLTVSFPNGVGVRAFGFDYRPSETWHVRFDAVVHDLTGGRRGFVGVVIIGGSPKHFNLYSKSYAQGGLSVDNISYVTAP